MYVYDISALLDLLSAISAVTVKRKGARTGQPTKWQNSQTHSRVRKQVVYKTSSPVVPSVSDVNHSDIHKGPKNTGKNKI